MQEAAKHPQLFQPRTPLNDGALSFYAGRVVPPVDAKEISILLQHQGELWMVGEDMPVLPDVDVQVVTQVDGLKLYRLQRKP